MPPSERLLQGGGEQGGSGSGSGSGSRRTSLSAIDDDDDAAAPPAPPPLFPGPSHDRSHGRRDSSSQVEEEALAGVGGGVDGDSAGGEDAVTAAATHHPIVLVRLPLRRPRARAWTREEEARLTIICQERWPRVDCECVRGVCMCGLVRPLFRRPERVRIRWILIGRRRDRSRRFDRRGFIRRD
jgi:hypothetical protein